jgi:hypothetical protein
MTIEEVLAVIAVVVVGGFLTDVLLDTFQRSL